MNKPTAIIGASDNPERYSYLATMRLKQRGHTVFPVGLKQGRIESESILSISDKPELPGVHTVTMYVSPRNQPMWIDYIYSLEPKRIIFNPGTENGDFIREASEKGIECVEACTLVMLSIGSY